MKAIAAGDSSPICWGEVYAVTLASILAIRSIREGIPFDIPNIIPFSASPDAPKIL